MKIGNEVKIISAPGWEDYINKVGFVYSINYKDEYPIKIEFWDGELFECKSWEVETV